MLLWAIIIFSVTSSIYGQENILEERIEALEKKTAALELKAESTQLRFEIGLFNTVENIILNLRNLQSSITATKTDQEITQNRVNKSTFKDDFSPTPVKSPCPNRKSNVCDCANLHVGMLEGLRPQTPDQTNKSNLFLIENQWFAFDKTIRRKRDDARAYCASAFGENFRGKIHEPRTKR